MNLQDFVKLLRRRWLTMSATTLITLLVTIAVTMLQTPLYEASTRLFVSTSGSSVSDIYQGNRFSQERVVSYAELAKGETLAQRTIDRLGLDMSAADLREEIKATSKPNTVLINVDVLDKSPIRARDIANALSDEFVKLVRELETPRPGATPDARLIVEQRATIPDKPISPKKSLNLLTGLGLGMILGIAFAAIRERLDNTVKDQNALEEMTGVGVIGTIPMDKERKTSPTILFEEDNSPIAEAFRKLRTNLQFLAVDDPPHVIVLTSSVPNEGKSTTSINIALCLAEAGHDVVIVDADLRRPSVHKYLDLVGQVGLSTVLFGGIPLSDALQSTKFTRLTVLTSGASPPNPSELLGSQAAKSLIADLRRKFDYVIIDSPPVLAVTDAAILAANADGALVLAKFGVTKTDQVAHAFENLANVGANPLGAILTMVPVRGHGYGYGYGYYGAQKREGEADFRKSL